MNASIEQIKTDNIYRFNTFLGIALLVASVWLFNFGCTVAWSEYTAVPETSTTAHGLLFIRFILVWCVFTVLLLVGVKLTIVGYKEWTRVQKVADNILVRQSVSPRRMAILVQASMEIMDLQEWMYPHPDYPDPEWDEAVESVGHSMTSHRDKLRLFRRRYSPYLPTELKTQIEQIISTAEKWVINDMAGALTGSERRYLADRLYKGLHSFSRDIEEFIALRT